MFSVCTLSVCVHCRCVYTVGVETFTTEPKRSLRTAPRPHGIIWCPLCEAAAWRKACRRPYAAMGRHPSGQPFGTALKSGERAARLVSGSHPSGHGSVGVGVGSHSGITMSNWKEDGP